MLQTMLASAKFYLEMQTLTAEGVDGQTEECACFPPVSIFRNAS